MNERLLTLWLAQIIVGVPLLLLTLTNVISDELFWIAILFMIFISILVPTKEKEVEPK